MPTLEGILLELGPAGLSSRFALECFYPTAFELLPSGATPGKRA